MKNVLVNWVEFWSDIAENLGYYVVIAVFMPLIIIPLLILLAYKYNEKRKLVKCEGGCGNKLKPRADTNTKEIICFNCLRIRRKETEQQNA